MKAKTKKRALLTSVMSLLLCFTMLLGTTFAWFTDTASSEGNKIVAGTLDVNLLMWDGSAYVDISESAAPIFGDGSIAQNNNAETKWEPGKTQVAYLAIENAGNLDLKYDVYLTVTDGAKDLYEVMRYTITPDAMGTDALLPAWDATAANAVEMGSQKVSDNDVFLGARSTHYFALSLHMLQEATDEYQGGDILFDITVRATQVASEEDSFGNGYDDEAPYPAFQALVIPPDTTEPTYLTVNDVTLEVPAGAMGGNYKLEVANTALITTNDRTTAAFDISLTRDGVKAHGEDYPVAIQVGTLLDVTEVKHNGVAVTNFDYNPLTGLVTFTTDSFSPFEVVYTELPVENVVIENAERITAGTFEGFDPAILDPSLTEADSEYIAVSYEKDGKTCFVVSKRANTVVVALPDTYVPVHDNYAENVKETASGSLYTVFAALKNEAFSTVYI
ncbi:MAG: hypothetical protein J6S44_05115, partial [Clostridia bacterium]|nr:hypothetical protein [Clostridia bacterium]